MRWCGVLAFVLVAVVVVTVRGLRRPHKRLAPRQPEVAEVAPPTVAPPAPSPSPPLAATAQSDSTGIARLRGRVLLPAGVERMSNLEVVAEDPARRMVAQVLADGRFDIHLPSGRYTLIATMGELVGVVPDVLARGEAGRDVDIRLGTGATIRGKLRAPTDVVLVAAVPAGRAEETGEPSTEQDSFSIGGLIPGRRYDLNFHGEGVRALTIAGVTAPADGLEHPLTGTRLFRLTCGADVGALEYQIGTQGTWRSVPIASVGDPAFVDLGSF